MSENLISLAEVTKFVVDNRGRTAPTAEKGIPLIATNCIDNKDLYPTYKNIRFVSEHTYENWFRSHPEPGDIILTLKGSQNGAVCLVPDPVDFVIAQDMVALRVNTDIIDQYYLFAVLRSREVQHQIKTLDVSGVIPHLKKTDFDKLIFHYPSKETQKYIGDTYYIFSKKIELLRAQNETLETLAQTVFKEWFVNSDNPSMSISNFIEFNPVEKIDRNREYLFFDMKTLPTDSMVMSEGVYKKSNSGTSFREKDTLLAKITPCLENGKTAFVLDLKGEEIARGSTEFIVMRAKRNGSPYLNYCLARYSLFRDYTVQSMVGTSGRQRVPIDRVMTFEIKFSPSKIEGFDIVLHPIFEKIKNNASQIQTLAKTRDTLLSKLMSGEVRIASNG